MNIATETATNLEELVSEVAERFTAEVAQGLSQSIDAYAEAHPGLAGIIRQVFPALALLDCSQGAIQPSGTKDGGVTGQLGDFRILQEIGRGGMGVVYEAEQISIGRRVALKVLPFAAMLDRAQLNRFKNEARAAGTLDHPNIVAVHSVGTERGVHYYAMQLVEGQSLAEVIAERKGDGEQRIGDGGRGTGDGEDATVEFHAHTPNSARRLSAVADNPNSALKNSPCTPSPVPCPPTDFPPVAALSTVPESNTQEYFRTVAQLGIQAAEALDHAHQNGIVHRDVKPGNLLVESSHLAPRDELRTRVSGKTESHHAERDPSTPKLYVTDFGLARIEADAGMTMTGDLLGTMRYMSPEQALAKRVVIDHRTDVYSLGATLYELLALQPAYHGHDRQELLKQIAFEDPQRLRQLNARIPVDLETIVAKAMEKNPTDRYATAQELSDDLGRFLSNEPIHAKPPTTGKRLAKWASRNRPQVIGMVLAFAAALALGGAYAWSQHQRTLHLESDVRESLAAARAFLQTKDYQAAQERITLAQVVFDESGRGDAELDADIIAMSREVKYQLEAKRKFDKFQQLKRGIGKDVHQDWRKALDLYQILKPGNIADIPEFQGLEEAVQQALREDIAELLFRLANDQRGRFLKPDADKAACRRAVDYLRRIKDVLGPTRGALLHMGLFWRVLGEDNVAQELEKRASEIEPKSAVDYYMLGWLPNLSTRKRLDYFYGALNLRPDHSPSIDHVCLIHMAHSEWTAAEAILTGHIALNPDHWQNYGFRGQARIAQGKLDLAEMDFLKGIENRPDSYNPRLTYASFLVQKGDFAEALASYNKSLEMNPSSDWALCCRGHLYQGLGDHDKAVSDFTTVLDEKLSQVDSPEGWDFVFWFVDRAFAYADSGQKVLASQDIEKAISIHSSTPRAQRYLAWFLATSPDQSLRNPELALSLAQDALRQARVSGTLETPKGAEYWLTLGVAQYRTGDWAGAAASFDKARDLDKYKLDLKAYGYFAAMTQWQLGSQDESGRWFDQAENAEYRRVNDWRSRYAGQWQIPDFRHEAAELLGIDAADPGPTEASSGINSKESED